MGNFATHTHCHCANIDKQGASKILLCSIEIYAFTEREKGIDVLPAPNDNFMNYHHVQYIVSEKVGSIVIHFKLAHQV